MRKLALLLTLITLTLVATAAFAQIPPDEAVGADFRTWLKETYFDGKHTGLGYSAAREAMYNYVDNHNDTLTCVYGGYQQYRKYGSTGTDVWPINAEHTVPQSFFSEDEPMRSDIHNLYPTYNVWNTIRGSYKFGDINDQSTTTWMRDTTQQSAIPTSNKDEYSEYAGSYYEPREDHKGNVARTIFYFYAMYPSYDINRVADPNLLYQWHQLDPVDGRELARNDEVEERQGNRNPFIDNPQWVARAYGFASEPDSELGNGDYRTLALGQDELAHYTVMLPANAATFTVAISGDGNADLYVRRNRTIVFPDDLGAHAAEDFQAPYLTDSNEAVSWTAPVSSTYHVVVYGRTEATAVDLTVSWGE
ncbi:MAG: endonuclease [Candidatus Schekmanbacteria bacterium]|nr:endonuclease [Candidatus Schekmanbacteria bacterium]